MGTQEDDVGSKTSSYSWEAWDEERTLQPTKMFFLDEFDFFFKEEKQTFYYIWTLGKENLTVWNVEFSYFFTGS